LAFKKLVNRQKWWVFDPQGTEGSLGLEMTFSTDGHHHRLITVIVVKRPGPLLIINKV